MSDTYGHRSDGTFRPYLVSDLCDWLIEHVVGPDLDFYDEDDRELNVLRNLLRLRRIHIDYAVRMAPAFASPEEVDRMRTKRRSVSKEAGFLGGLPYVDPVEERIREEGYVLGLESAIMELAGRYRAFVGIGGIFRAPAVERSHD